MGYPLHKILLDASASTVTSRTVLIADAQSLVLSYVTITGTASNLTVQVSNDHGITSSIQSWSNASIVAAQGVFTIDPGGRWLRVLRPSAETQAAVMLSGYVAR